MRSIFAQNAEVNLESAAICGKSDLRNVRYLFIYIIPDRYMNMNDPFKQCGPHTATQIVLIELKITGKRFAG
jgi:hypothetical protein